MTAPQSHVIQTRSAATPASEIPAAPVLLEEGVEGGEQLGHDSLPLRPTRVICLGETWLLLVG